MKNEILTISAFWTEIYLNLKDSILKGARVRDWDFGLVCAWINNVKNINLTPFFPKNSPKKLIMEYVADSVYRLKKIYGLPE